MDKDRNASAIPIVIQVLIILTALILVIAAARTDGIDPGFVLAGGIGLLAFSLFSLIGYLVTVVAPRLALSAKGGRVKKGLDGLNEGISKLGVGDLAASVPGMGREGALVARGELAFLAGLMDEIRDSVDEAIEDFNGITSEPCRRLFYVGSDSYIEGRACGAVAGRLLGGEGEVGIIVSDLRMVNHGLRKKGFLGALAEDFPGVREVRTVETFRSPEQTYEAVMAMFKYHPELRAVYVTEGNTPSSAAKAVIDSGREGKTVVITYDLTDATMEYVVRGVIATTMSQDPYAQGYDSAILLFNAIAAGWRPSVPRLLVRLEAVAAANARTFWSREEGMLTGDPARLAAPADVSPSRRVKIAVVNFTGAGFWKMVRRGAEDAGKALSALNANVDWVEAEPAEEGGMAATTFEPVIKRLVAEGYHGIALPVFDRALIPTVNEAIAAGVLVATINSEPVSLREMISSAADHADRLISLSQELAASSTESGQAANSVGGTMSRIAENLGRQVSDADRTGNELSTLAGSVDKASRAVAESAESARLMADASKSGLSSVSGLKRAIVSLEGVSDMSDRTIRELKAGTDRIAAILGEITDIVGRTNVLAINASIQAARAGEGGKAFAVVAAEIRRLAEQTNSLAGNIGEVVDDIRKRATNAVEASDLGLKRARENATDAEISRRSLESIDALVQEHERRMRDIAAAIGEMARFSRGVEETMRSLAEANARGDEAVEDVDRSMKEMSTQATEVSRAAQNLLDMAQAQLALLSRFKTEAR